MSITLTIWREFFVKRFSRFNPSARSAISRARTATTRTLKFRWGAVCLAAATFQIVFAQEAAKTRAGGEGEGRRSSRIEVVDLDQYWSRGRATGSGPVQFSHSPLRIEDIQKILPMGLMVGAHVTPSDHQYYVLKEMDSDRFRYDVFAPADGFVVMVQHRVAMQGNDGPKERDDYRLVIEHSRTIWSYYDLLTRLDDALLVHWGGKYPRGQNQWVRIPVKAGQVIGKIGGRTLDFAVVNSQSTLKGFVVPEHYAREPWKIHTVDPFDFFKEPLRTKLLALNPRLTAPRGGKIDYDIDGFLVGNWFLEDSKGYAGAGDSRGYWVGHLTFAYHHIDTAKIVISIGDYAGASRQFGIKDNAPDPARISPETGPVKFELIAMQRPNAEEPFKDSPNRVEGVLIAHLIGKRKLAVECFPGKRASEVSGFTAAARMYER